MASHDRGLNKINKEQVLKRFLVAVSEGATMMTGGKKAGISHPESFIARELHNPDFLPAMAHALRHRLGGALSLKAMNLAESILDDKQASLRVRWDVAKTILAAGAGFVPPKAKEMDDAPKDIAQMSGEDIMRLREQLNAESIRRADGAKLIEHAPQSYSNLD